MKIIGPGVVSHCKGNHYMAHWESWLIRHTVTVEITGSSPVWVAKNTQKVQFLPITHEFE